MIIKKIGIFITSLLIIVTVSHADIRKEIEELENGKVNVSQQVEKNNYLLPNGKSVDLNEWNIVIFIQSTCKYCKEFDPIIKEFANEKNIKTTVFSFDGLSDGNFDLVLPVSNEIVANFFRDLPVATPTVFLVNIDNLITLPVSQGSMTKVDFENQIKKTLMSVPDGED